MAIQLGIIGGGVMAEALLSRLLAAQIFAPETILVSEPMQSRREDLQQRYGIATTSDNRVAATASEVLLLAIKPQVFESVVQALGGLEGQLVVLSILAGVPLVKLEAAFPHSPVVRAMPNTPATIGAGMTALAPGARVQPPQMQLARRLFEAVGQVVEVPESMMDAVTGLSGSGPGYIALVIEALADGGVAAGLPRAIALQLAAQTVKGTAELLQVTQMHPGALKDQVTSPGGTTIAGVATLEQAGLRSALIEAVRVAAARSKELGQQ
jgi:pyrroline-5-carboxylate reductase